MIEMGDGHTDMLHQESTEQPSDYATYYAGNSADCCEKPGPVLSRQDHGNEHQVNGDREDRRFCHGDNDKPPYGFG